MRAAMAKKVEKGQRIKLLKEIPEMFTVRTSLLIKPVVEKVITCPECFSQLEKLFAFFSLLWA